MRYDLSDFERASWACAIACGQVEWTDFHLFHQFDSRAKWLAWPLAAVPQLRELFLQGITDQRVTNR
jgi:hypothetical protein